MSTVSDGCLSGHQTHVKALLECFRNELDQKTALGVSFATLLVNSGLVFVILLIVTDDIVAVWIALIEFVISCILGTLFVFHYNIVWVKHGFIILLLVQSELFLPAGVGRLRAQLNDCFSELI